MIASIDTTALNNKTTIEINYSIIKNTPMRAKKNSKMLFFAVIFCSLYIQGTGHIKVLLQNVGGADVVLSRDGIYKPYCPVFKLCHPEIIDRLRNEIAEHLPDLILLQETQGVKQLKWGENFDNPILPDDYEVQCTLGSGGIEEVCIAWNTNTLKLKNKCTKHFLSQSGIIKCSFISISSEMEFSAIDLHPSLWNIKERKSINEYLWTKLIKKNENILIGGDFNSEKETYYLDSQFPYPPDFGTIFGRSIKNYGRWREKDSFYGYREISKVDGVKISKLKNMNGSTVIRRKLDHLFANFGELFDENIDYKNIMPCKNSVCFGNNHDGFKWNDVDWQINPSIGPRTDHYPILAIISLKVTSTN